MEVNDYFIKRLRPIFEENGLDESKITQLPINSSDKTKIKYKCICDKDLEKSIKGFRKKPLCNTCIPRKGQKTLIDFINLIALDGCVIDESNTNRYINTKTYMRIKNSKGDVYTTNYNKFASEHRSRAEAIENQKLTLEEVKRRVKNGGFIWTDDTIYVNKKTPMNVICERCLAHTTVKIENLREDKERVGCQLCYRFNRVDYWGNIEKAAEENDCIIFTPKTNYKGRDHLIEILCPCGIGMFKKARNFVKAPRCMFCSDKKRYETNKERYGNGEMFATEYFRKKNKEHHNIKYGDDVNHNMQIKKEHLGEGELTPHEKAVKTHRENSDYDFAIMVPENRKKAEDAFFKNHGCTFGNDPKMQEKSKNTSQERYGADSFMISEEGRALMVIKCGQEYYAQSEPFFECMLERYGVKYAMQNPILFEKAMKNAYSQKPYKYPSGNIVYIQGYEWMCLDYLQKHENLTENDIVVGATKVPEVKYKFGDVRHYYMDIYIPSQDKAIEVKSDYTYSYETQIEKNTAKWLKCSHKFKGGIDIYVFHAKGLLFRQTLKNGKIVDEKIVKKCKEYECYNFER